MPFNLCSFSISSCLVTLFYVQKQLCTCVGGLGSWAQFSYFPLAVRRLLNWEEGAGYVHPMRSEQKTVVTGQVLEIAQMPSQVGSVLFLF